VRRGHVMGTKREKKGASDWYAKYAMAHIERIEKEWQAAHDNRQQQARRTAQEDADETV